MEQKSFSAIYKALPVTPPKREFVLRMMALTMKTEVTIYRWISGEVQPDELTKSVISKELGVPAEVLFPPKKEA